MSLGRMATQSPRWFMTSTKSLGQIVTTIPTTRAQVHTTVNLEPQRLASPLLRISARFPTPRMTTEAINSSRQLVERPTTMMTSSRSKTAWATRTPSMIKPSRRHLEFSSQGRGSPRTRRRGRDSRSSSPKYQHTQSLASTNSQTHRNPTPRSQSRSRGLATANLGPGKTNSTNTTITVNLMVGSMSSSQSSQRARWSRTTPNLDWRPTHRRNNTQIDSWTIASRRSKRSR